MMKKLSKIALLAAATAFLLGGMTACFTSVSDDEKEASGGSGSGGSGSGGSESSGAGGTETYTLESSALTAFDKGGKSDADETTEGTDGYFTISWSASMAVDTSAKTWDDGYSSGQRINMGGGWTGSKQFIKFTTTKAATVKVWWASNEKPLAIAKFTGSTPTDTIDSTDAGEKNNAYTAEFSLEEAGTWVVGFVGGGGYIFKVEVTE